jgi:hypothetical protein
MLNSHEDIIRHPILGPIYHSVLSLVDGLPPGATTSALLEVVVTIPDRLPPDYPKTDFTRTLINALRACADDLSKDIDN